MSMYSGKCDLCDMLPDKVDITKIKLFLRKNERIYPLKLENDRDLIPYYPYVPYLSYGNFEGVRVFHISESFIDVEERDILQHELDRLLKAYRAAKRKKVPYAPSEYEKTHYNKTLIKRVEEQGNKATIDGIHRSFSNYYRKCLAEKMKTNGYSDMEIINWVYPEASTTKFDWRTDEY